MKVIKYKSVAEYFSLSQGLSSIPKGLSTYENLICDFIVPKLILASIIAKQKNVFFKTVSYL